MSDPYLILNVSPDATEDEIKKAYRKIAMDNHPDKNGGDPAKTEFFRNATDAYHFLLDKNQREAYDYYRESQNVSYSDTFYQQKTQQNKAQSAKTEKELHNAFEEAKANLSEMWINILIGLGSLALGSIPTLISYMMAEPGGTYRIFYGTMLAGALGIIKGVFGTISALGKMAGIKMKEKKIFGERNSNEESRNNGNSYGSYSSSSKGASNESNDAKQNNTGKAKNGYTGTSYSRATHNNDQVMFCYKCGNALDSDSLFCDKCGAQVR